MIDKDHDGCLNLSRWNIGNSCCKIIGLAFEDYRFQESVKIIDVSNNLRIGDQGIQAIMKGLNYWNNNRLWMKKMNLKLKLSDISIQSYNQLQKLKTKINQPQQQQQQEEEEEEMNHIEIDCNFPSLLIISTEWIVNQLNQNI